jgi:hypothetical protein
MYPEHHRQILTKLVAEFLSSDNSSASYAWTESSLEYLCLTSWTSAKDPSISSFSTFASLDDEL